MGKAYVTTQEFAMPVQGRIPLTQRVAGAAGILSALTLMTGCVSEARGANASEPAVTATPVTVSVKDLRLPLDGYLPTSRQIRQMDRARIVLIDRCMQRFHFRYKVKFPAETPGSDASNSRRYGITDSGLAAEKGYGLSDDTGSLRARPATPKLGPQAQTVLYGEGSSSINGSRVPDGGCLGEANRGLDARSPRGADFTATQQLSFESFRLSQRDSRVRNAVKTWSNCMADLGYHYSDPLAPLADPQLGDGTGAKAVKTAQSDLLCKKNSNLVGVWFAVESAFQKQLIERHSALVNATRQARDARLSIASSLVHGGGS